MLRRYSVWVISFTLVITGAFFFVSVVFGNESGVIVGQPQLDTPATVEKEAIGNTAVTENAPAELAEQMKASSSVAVKSRQPSANGQRERYRSHDDEEAPK